MEDAKKVHPFRRKHRRGKRGGRKHRAAEIVKEVESKRAEREKVLVLKDLLLRMAP